MVLQHVENARERQINYYDMGRKDVEFEVGNMVWRVNHVLSDGAQHFSKKLAPNLIGPYQIRKTTHSYSLQARYRERKNPNVNVLEFARKFNIMTVFTALVEVITAVVSAFVTVTAVFTALVAETTDETAVTNSARPLAVATSVKFSSLYRT